IVEIAFFNAAEAASLSFAATAASTFLIEVFTADLMDLFLSAFVLFTKILFFADLMLAKVYTSKCDHSIYLLLYLYFYRRRHGILRYHMLFHSSVFGEKCQYIKSLKLQKIWKNRHRKDVFSWQWEEFIQT